MREQPLHKKCDKVFRGRSRRRWIYLLLLLLALPFNSACLTLNTENPFDSFFDLVLPDSGSDPVPEGYFGIVFLNHSSFLVQTIVSLTYPGENPQVWVTPVTPYSWESLLPECGLTEISISGVLPINLETSADEQEVSYAGSSLVVGEDIVCGSTIVLEITDNTDSTSDEPVSLKVTTIPEALKHSTSYKYYSATTPGPDSRFVLVRPESIEDVETELTASWESESGLVYVLSWSFKGASLGMASLLECPVVQIGWGDITDSAEAGAIVGPAEVELDVPESLVSGVGYQCGDAIILGVNGDREHLEEAVLSIETAEPDSEVGSNQLDLFGNIRQLLDETGFAGRLSNANALQSPLDD